MKKCMDYSIWVGISFRHVKSPRPWKITNFLYRRRNMTKLNMNKKCCKDVFNAFMVDKAFYTNDFEIPCIEKVTDVPNRLIPFSKINQSNDKDCWIHFYEHDYIIERIWKYPQKYLDLLKEYNGVILPDFSLYRDMPIIYQCFNIYRSRAVGRWLLDNGIKCIANIRFGDDRTLGIACSGIPEGSTVAIGSHGAMKNKEDRLIIESGIEGILNQINPQNLIIYGTINDRIKTQCKHNRTNLIVFESDFSLSRRKEREVK